MWWIENWCVWVSLSVLNWLHYVMNRELVFGYHWVFINCLHYVMNRELVFWLHWVFINWLHYVMNRELVFGLHWVLINCLHYVVNSELGFGVNIEWWHVNCSHVMNNELVFRVHCMLRTPLYIINETMLDHGSFCRIQNFFLDTMRVFGAMALFWGYFGIRKHCPKLLKGF